MRFLIVGLGSIGRRHLANLRCIQSDAQITVWRQHTAPEAQLPDGVDRVVYSFDDAMADQPTAALICSPASMHVGTGLQLAREGVHLFIEKPLSDTLEGVEELVQTCRQKSLVLMVGYNLRFYNPLQIAHGAFAAGSIGRLMSLRAEVGQFLPDWRPGQDYRQSVSARSELGGGALMELSHELDYVDWFAGEIVEVSARLGRLSDLDMDVEDTAELIVGFRGGAIGSIHLDMVQRAPVRHCRLVGTEGTLTWDGISNCVRLYSAASGEWEDLHPAVPIDRNEMFAAELDHFVDCVVNDKAPTVDGRQGQRVLALALAAKEASLQGRSVDI
jgi:predicted dehydrogenase